MSKATRRRSAAAPHNYIRVDTDRGPESWRMVVTPTFPAGPIRCSSTMQPRTAAGAARRAYRDCRDMRRRSLRHGDADAARNLPAHLGHHAGTVLAEEQRQPYTRNTPTSPSWPKSTGISNGRCSSKASTIATISGYMTGLREAKPRPVRDHLIAGLDYQDKLARFLENHDEPRAASAFSWPQHQAAAIITFLSPGLRFFHQGQFEGARLRIPGICIAVRLSRSNAEIADLLRQAAAGLKDETAPSATVTGSRSNPSRPGPAIGLRTTSSHTPGPARTAVAISSSSITPAIRGNVGSFRPFRNSATIDRCG